MRVVPTENPGPKTYGEASIQVLANGDAVFGGAHFSLSRGHLKGQLAQGNRIVILHDSFVLNAEDGIEVDLGIVFCVQPHHAEAMKTQTPLAALILLAATTFAAPMAASAVAPVAEPATAPVYVIPIYGQIEGALLYVIRRGIAEAERQNAVAIILPMDTPGGTLNAASDIVRTIQSAKMPVYTFVEKDAFSAGAIIALATRGIYMAPGSVIGDALPIMMSPFGGVQEMPAAMEEKAVSAVAALIRSAAQEAGHNPELAENMVRRETEFKVGDDIICPAGRLLTLTAEEAMRPGADQQPLLAAGTPKNLDDLFNLLALGNHPQVTMQITAAEKVARWIAAAAPILLMLGLLAIYIEIKTPGFGLPGLLGIGCLILFFWGHHIAGLAGMEDLVIFMIGVGLLLIEIFLIPGFGITGVTGLLFIVFALIGAMVRVVPGGPWFPAWPDLQSAIFKTGVAFVGTGIGAVILGRFLPRSRWFGRLTLQVEHSAATGYTATPDTANLIGQTGVALTPLRPGGVARIQGQRRDVMTSGEFLESATPLEVIAAHGNRILVKQVPLQQPRRGSD